MKKLLALAMLLAATIAVAIAPGPTDAAPMQMPTDPATAERIFEADIENFNKGPASYLFLKDEDEIWRDLENDDDRARFIQWFWDRRDDDLRDRQHPMKAGFYTRVAEANRRFRGFPRGWRSDRGRVFIVLGQPNGKRTQMSTENEIWTYSTGSLLAAFSYLGELQVAFRLVRTSTWEVTGGLGPGIWPEYVLRALQAVNQAQILDPFLEFQD